MDKGTMMSTEYRLHQLNGERIEPVIIDDVKNSQLTPQERYRMILGAAPWGCEEVAGPDYVYDCYDPMAAVKQAAVGKVTKLDPPKLYIASEEDILTEIEIGEIEIFVLPGPGSDADCDAAVVAAQLEVDAQMISVDKVEGGGFQWRWVTAREYLQSRRGTREPLSGSAEETAAERHLGAILKAAKRELRVGDYNSAVSGTIASRYPWEYQRQLVALERVIREAYLASAVHTSKPAKYCDYVISAIGKAANENGIGGRLGRLSMFWDKKDLRRLIVTGVLTRFTVDSHELQTAYSCAWLSRKSARSWSVPGCIVQ